MCLLHLHENDIFTKNAIKKFRILIYFIMFEIVIDTIFEALNGNTNIPILALYLLKALELLLNPVLTLIAFNVFNSKNTNNKKNQIEMVRKILLAIIIINIVAQIALLQGNLIFYIDDNHIYHRNGLMPLYVFILVLCVALLVYGIKLQSDNKQNIMKYTLSIFFVIFCVGVTLKGFFSRTNFDWLCVSISVLFLLIYYSNVTLKVDSLTQLLNRQVYIRFIERIDFTTLIIMIDANNFKLINDTYGHECGDKTLKILSHLIFKAYSRYAYCFRIGGDEFCVILKPGVFEKLVEETPHCDAYAMAESFMEKLENLILEQIKEKKRDSEFLKYGVSQGYGIYYSTKNYPSIKERKSLEKVIKLADKRMYRSKEKFKKKKVHMAV